MTPTDGPAALAGTTHDTDTDTDTDTEIEALEPESGSSNHYGLIIGSMVVMTLIAIGFGLMFWMIAKPPAAEHLTFTIPAGTDARIAMLEKVDILPAEIRIRRGGEITLINEDRTAFQFGTLSVGAGQRITKKFNDLGTFRNTCRLTVGQQVLITVY